MSAVDASIVIVSYNTRDLLVRCLDALPAAVAPFRHEAIVVDNGSRDGTVAALQARDDVRVIERPENPGFARATNLGIAAAGGRAIVWLNPDCEPAPGSLATLLRHVDAHPGTGAAGPLLVYPDGRPQPSAQAFPHASLVLYRFLGLGRLTRWPGLRTLARHAGPTTRSYVAATETSSEPRSVDWISGACLVTTADHAREVGPLDEGYFMYCEDADWCQRVRARGLAVDFVPGARVVHHVGASAPANPQLVYWFYRSMLRYFRRYRAGEFPLLCVAMFPAFVLRGIARDLARLVGRSGGNPWWRLASLCLAPAARLEGRA